MQKKLSAQSNPLFSVTSWFTRPSNVWLTMVVILLGATAMRLYGLTLQSFWLDELMTWGRSRYPDLPTVILSVSTDVWPPGYSIFVYFLIHIVGASEFLLRFPAAMAGIMGVAAIYTLGRHLIDHYAGLIAALLMSVLEVAIYYSQEARPYSALILYTILSTYFWLRCLEALSRSGRVRTRDVAGYILFALLAAYWNYYGVLAVALQGLGAGIWILRRPRLWPRVGLWYGIILVGYAPWIPNLLNDFGRDQYFAAPPMDYIGELMHYFRFLLNLKHLYVQVAIGIVGLGFATDLWRRWRGENVGLWRWLLLLAWLLLPFSITYLKSITSASLLVHRYLLIALPAAILLIAYGLTRLPLRSPIAMGLALICAVALVYNLATWWDYYQRITKAQFREAAYYIATCDPELDGKSIIIGYDGYEGTEHLFEFYFQQAGFPREVDVGAGHETDISRVQAVVAEKKPRYIWYVYAQNSPDDAFLAYLDKTFHRVDYQSMYYAGVWLYENR
jgi:mannosyltransferase